MTTCPHCGIEREPQMTECPLCGGTYLEDPMTGSTKQPAYPGLDKALSKSERIRIFWELSGLFHLSAGVMLLLIDIMLNRKPGWSLYALAGIAASYCLITLIVFLARKPFILLSGILLDTCALLFAIDIANGRLTWFLIPALPLVIFPILLTMVIFLLGRLAEHKGLNLVAASAIGIGLYILFMEACLNLANHGRVLFTWSLVVAASILPFALILLYIHYRLKRGINLRKFFHL